MIPHINTDPSRNAYQVTLFFFFKLISSLTPRLKVTKLYDKEDVIMKSKHPPIEIKSGARYPKLSWDFPKNKAYKRKIIPI